MNIQVKVTPPVYEKKRAVILDDTATPSNSSCYKTIYVHMCIIHMMYDIIGVRFKVQAQMEGMLVHVSIIFRLQFIYHKTINELSLYSGIRQRFNTYPSSSLTA